MTAALASGHGIHLTIRTPATTDSTRVVREIVELSALPALEGPMKSLFSTTGMTVADQDIPGLERAGMALFLRDVPKSSQFGVAWGVRDGELRVAASEEPRPLLVETIASKTLADDPLVTAMVHALGDRTSFGVVARPFPSDSASLPVLTAGLGAGWVRVDASNGFVREFVRRRSGL